MGAIAGVFDREGGTPCPALLARQSAVLAHRGPIGGEVWGAGPVGLVHRRNAVRPPAARDGQPFAAAGCRAVLSGRIFNAGEIAESLAAQGRRLEAPSVLALIVHAYRAWGKDAFRRFNGAFACALWDEEEESLLLAHDHFGLQPLYYHLGERRLVFGSEAKAVLADPDCDREPDEVGIANYLAVNRYLFRSEHTFYKGVKKLLPAEALTVDRRHAKRTVYWRLDPEREDSYASAGECVEAVRDLLLDSVRVRMPEGERLGAALSGGFDSSSVVCMLAHLRDGGPSAVPLDTFSLDFGSDDADEIPLIDLVAGRVGARHHHIDALSPTFFEDLDALIRAHDGPIVESSILLLWAKKRAARAAGIDVLFSGLGGDEIFLGTLHYLSDLLRGGRLRELVRELRSVYPLDHSTGRRTSLKKLAVAYVLSPLIPDGIRRWRRRHLGRPFPPPWISRELRARTGLGDDLPRSSGRFRTAYGMAAFDLFHYELVAGVIPYQDTCSGAFAVDTRFPYLDVRLVEALFALPREWKIGNGQVRPLQKRAMAGLLPDEILKDHLKKNFHPALHRFTERAFREPIRGLLEAKDPESRPYLDWDVLRAQGEAFLAGGLADPTSLWCAINLERWLSSRPR